MQRTAHTDRWKNAQRQARESPDTFGAPSQEALAWLAEGDYVKVCGRACERFWARIVAVNGEQITAEVSNDLVMESDYDKGDLIVFQKKHVYDIQRRPRS
jgi:hypothetical protein